MSYMPTPVRLAETAFGWTLAAAAAYGDFTAQSLDMYTQTVKNAATSGGLKRSWYREPAPLDLWNAERSLRTLQDFMTFSPFSTSAFPTSSFPGVAGSAWQNHMWSETLKAAVLWNLGPSPHALFPTRGMGNNAMSAWIDMLTFRGTPAAWPTAFFLIVAGVPREWAWPAAEANAAALQVADKAASSLQSVVAHYRTESGHATHAFLRTPTQAFFESMTPRPYWAF